MAVSTLVEDIRSKIEEHVQLQYRALMQDDIKAFRGGARRANDAAEGGRPEREYAPSMAETGVTWPQIEARMQEMADALQEHIVAAWSEFNGGSAPEQQATRVAEA